MADMSLKVVGAGMLGARVAILWKQKFPDAKIYLKTRSDKAERSAKWKAAGFIPLAQDTEDNVKAAYVVYSAPAAGDPGYAASVAKCVADDWSKEGNFVFTSSGGVYTENSGGTVNETSEVKNSTKHSRRGNSDILGAEKAVEAGNGITIRFAGLYVKDNGVHNYWLKRGRTSLDRAPNGFVNLIHYDDAARSVMAALTSAKADHGRLYLASDANPITRIDICKSAKKCPDYADCTIPQFTGDPNEVNNKKYDPTKIMTELNWKPEFPSFDAFMSGLYKNEMTVDIVGFSNII